MWAVGHGGRIQLAGRPEQKIGGGRGAVVGDHGNGDEVGALGLGEGLGIPQQREADVICHEDGVAGVVQHPHHSIVPVGTGVVSGLVLCRSPAYPVAATDVRWTVGRSAARSEGTLGKRPRSGASAPVFDPVRVRREPMSHAVQYGFDSAGGADLAVDGADV